MRYLLAYCFNVKTEIRFRNQLYTITIRSAGYSNVSTMLLEYHKYKFWIIYTSKNFNLNYIMYDRIQFDNVKHLIEYFTVYITRISPI